MLLNVAFPNSLVMASDLFRRSNEYLSLVMMQISEIDDERNGLLLFKHLEYAFDNFQISFILDDTNTFLLKLFDPSLRGIRLIDLTDRSGNKSIQRLADTSASQQRIVVDKAVPLRCPDNIW
jgi:hypothetical protein